MQSSWLGVIAAVVSGQQTMRRVGTGGRAESAERRREKKCADGKNRRRLTEVAEVRPLPQFECAGQLQRRQHPDDGERPQLDGRRKVRQLAEVEGNRILHDRTAAEIWCSIVSKVPAEIGGNGEVLQTICILIRQMRLD